MVVAATNFTVAVTTFVLGALTVPALNWFKIEYGSAAHVVFDDESNNSKDDENIVSNRSRTSSVHEMKHEYSISSVVNYVVALEKRIIQRHFRDNLDKKKGNLKFNNNTGNKPPAGISSSNTRVSGLDSERSSATSQMVGESKYGVEMSRWE